MKGFPLFIILASSYFAAPITVVEFNHTKWDRRKILKQLKGSQLQFHKSIRENQLRGWNPEWNLCLLGLQGPKQQPSNDYKLPSNEESHDYCDAKGLLFCCAVAPSIRPDESRGKSTSSEASSETAPPSYWVPRLAMMDLGNLHLAMKFPLAYPHRSRSTSFSWVRGRR